MIVRRSRFSSPLVGALVACALGTLTVCADDEPPPQTQQQQSPQQKTPSAAVAPRLSLRLRLEWGGGPSRRRAGTAELTGGVLQDSLALGVEADEPGSMFVRDGRWQVEPRTPRSYDGVDLTAIGTTDSRLIVVLTDVDAQTTSRHEIPLASLVDGSYNAALNDGENRLAVRRTPGDRLRVKVGHDALVFSPGETLQLEVEPHRLGLAAETAVRLSASLSPARQTKSLWNDSAELNSPGDDDAWSRLPLSIRLPEAEGVYDVVLELGRRDLTSRLRMAAATERRKIQVVVLSTQPPPRRTDEAEPAQTLVEFDPASPGWWDRALHAAGTNGLRRGPQGNAKPGARAVGGTTFVELPPHAADAEPAWQAYPLPVSKPGLPHIVELEYPTDVAQSPCISLVEPNAAGAVLPVGIDAGLFIDGGDSGREARKGVRRFVVWPRTTQPLLVVANPRRDVSALYGKIRLLGPRTTMIPYLTRQGEAAHLPSARLPEARADGRLVAAYYDKPLFPENFGASAALDDGSDGQRRVLDDWQTFYDGTRRLLDYLAYTGQNGVMLTVVADGGAIYPSRLLEPTPRYDDGVFFDTAQDPLRKDVVELLLRMCDREGVRVVPTLQFSAPLPALEALQRAESQSLAPLGLDGRSWSAANGADGGLGPRYDPLHPSVRREMLAVVREFTERYGRHPSLVGMAVQLSADGYTQSPGPEWSLHADVLTQFCAERKLAAPENLAREERARFVLERHRDAWTAWRKETLTQFYAELQQVVAERVPLRKLYLATAYAWHRSDLQSRLQPSLPSRASFDETLGEMGLDAARLAALPGVVWMRPYREAPFDAPAAHGTEIELNRDEGLDRIAVSQRLTASLLFNVPQSLRLESLEKQLPHQPAYVRLVTQAARAGTSARRALVHQLATTDACETFYGGWLLPAGSQDELRRFAGVVRALPNERFTTVGGGPSHVVVRTLSRSDRTYVYVVNDAPWPTTVTFASAAAADCAWRGFGEAAWTKVGGSNRMQVSLEPYDVAGGAFLQSGVAVSNVQADVPPDVGPRLTEQIARLWTKCRGLQRAPSFAPPANLDFEFEPTADEPVPDWAVEPATKDSDASATMTTDGPHAGKRAVKFVADGPARLVGRTFAVPQCGRLSISVWLKTVDDRQPPLRMALEGTLGGKPYYRYAAVGAGTNVPELARDWKQFVFQIHDLPTQELTSTRVVFDLAGAGAVALDDVSLSDLEFTNAERVELSKIVSLAEYRLQHGEFGACERLLEGYWPRFLTKYVPTNESEVAVAARPTSPPASSKPPPPAPSGESTPSLIDRLRKRLPDLWVR